MSDKVMREALVELITAVEHATIKTNGPGFFRMVAAVEAGSKALAQHDQRGKPMGWYGTLDDDFGFNRADFYLHESELVAKGLVLPLYTAPPAPTVPDVDALAQFIREIDGKHQMGAGVMAERIVEWLAAAPEVRS